MFQEVPVRVLGDIWYCDWEQIFQNARNVERKINIVFPPSFNISKNWLVLKFKKMFTWDGENNNSASFMVSLIDKDIGFFRFFKYYGTSGVMYTPAVGTMAMRMFLRGLGEYLCFLLRHCMKH